MRVLFLESISAITVTRNSNRDKNIQTALQNAGAAIRELERFRTQRICIVPESSVAPDRKHPLPGSPNYETTVGSRHDSMD
jgi:hypothetical protein